MWEWRSHHTCFGSQIWNLRVKQVSLFDRWSIWLETLTLKLFIIFQCLTYFAIATLKHTLFTFSSNTCCWYIWSYPTVNVYFKQPTLRTQAFRSITNMMHFLIIVNQCGPMRLAGLAEYRTLLRFPHISSNYRCWSMVKRNSQLCIADVSKLKFWCRWLTSSNGFVR